MDQSLIFLIKAAKCVLDDILGISSLHHVISLCALVTVSTHLEPLPEHGEEHGEVDGAGSLAHHPIQVLLSGVLAQAGQHVVQVLVVNEPVPVLVNHVEGLLELLDLVLVEHGEHIAGGSLGPLLGGAPPPGCFARRHPALLSNYV